MASESMLPLFKSLYVSLIAILFVWFLQTLARALYNVFLHPLRRYPGPKTWAASALPGTWNQVLGRDVKRILELHEKYGSVVRTAPDELSYSDPVVWKDVFAHRQGHEEFSKSERSRVLPPNGVYGILLTDRADHSRHRRAFAASFSDRGMQRQQPIIKRHIDLLMKGLKECAPEGPQDMTAWFNWTTFDIIGNLTFGESFDCLEKKRMHPWIAAVFGNLKGVSIMGALKRLGLGPIVPYIIPKKAAAMRLQNAQFAADRIRSRMEMGTDRGDFMDSVLEKHVGPHQGGSNLSFDELSSTGSHLVLAGSETTATLLSGVVYQLLKHPEHLRKTVDEVRSSFDSPEEINLFSTAKLRYMLAVLDETMRIYPPVPSQTTRSSPPGGDTIDGKYIPEKSVVFVSQYVMHHLEQNFTKPWEFHPERFLRGEDGLLKKDSEFANDNFAAFQPFSVGPRNCIGRNLAYAEMRQILASLLFDFDLELDERSEHWTENQKVFILWEKPALLVKLTERHKTSQHG